MTTFSFAILMIFASPNEMVPEAGAVDAVKIPVHPIVSVETAPATTEGVDVDHSRLSYIRRLV